MVGMSAFDDPDTMPGGHDERMEDLAGEEARRAKAQVGDRIRLTEPMLNDPAPIEVGAEGTVTFVSQFDGAGGWWQLGVDWDSGRTLMLTTGDKFEVIK